MSRPGPIRTLMVCAFVLLALHFAHSLFGLGGHDSRLFNAYVYDGLMITAAILCLSRAALVRAERGAWLAFGIGLASYAVGEIYWSVAIGDDPTPPIPSPADLLYLGFYPPAYIGVVLLARSRVREFRSSLWLDGAIGALAVAAVAAAVLFDRVLSATEGSPGAVATTMAYPLADLLLLSIIVGLVTVTGWQLAGNAALVAGSLVVAAIADGTYLLQTTAGTYQEGYALDSAWLTANLLLGCAAWLPSPAPHPLRLDRLRVVAAPVLFGLTAVAVLLYGVFGESHASAPVLASAVLLAVIGRVVLSFRENLRLLATSRDEAMCDPLTGLRNRRALMADLPWAIESARARDPQVLVLMDLNGFKAYNDSYGHLAGDALLTRVATNLSRSVAGSGHAYRLGGRRVLRGGGVARAHRRGRRRRHRRRAARARRRVHDRSLLRNGAAARRGARRPQRDGDRRPAPVRAQGRPESLSRPGSAPGDGRVIGSGADGAPVRARLPAQVPLVGCDHERARVAGRAGGVRDGGRVAGRVP